MTEELDSWMRFGIEVHEFRDQKVQHVCFIVYDVGFSPNSTGISIQLTMTWDPLLPRVEGSQYASVSLFGINQLCFVTAWRFHRDRFPLSRCGLDMEKCISTTPPSSGSS
ncbi:hypothetical protein M514_10705 [Trichuris suis]|uniref:Uncharacterized protein n=1 Tax=Trichuris suis TaxID=68888 RepID=A0A085MYZ1_9BILA|nr:hypothetical protein M513_10705 [Trichuris suis]KFD62437.1 hypothetical protein M514_10705 [Trichuris suis]